MMEMGSKSEEHKSTCPLYQPLNTERDEFRLLTIEAGAPDSPLSSLLTIVPLGEYTRHLEGVYHWSTGTVSSHDWEPDPDTESPICWVQDYEALSYAWGDATAQKPIVVNNQPMQIRANLFSALQNFRYPDKNRVLWIDALCIDQSNLTERSEQVQHMQAIYQRARRTLVWLGDADEHSLRAMDLLERLGPSQEHLDRFAWPEDHLFGWIGPHFEPCYGLAEMEGEFKRYLENYLATLDLMSPGDLSEADWDILDRFLNGKAYWRRLWIVQEIANSQQVQVWCGGRSMGWDTFQYLETRLSGIEVESYDLFLRTITNSGPYKIMYQRRSTRHKTRSLGFEKNDSSFLNLLERFRGFECTDPRDKVYALLGLATIDKDMPLPRPDYEKDVAEVYCETVRAIIAYSADLTVLCMPKPSRPGALDLPSWVPDWTRSTNSKPLIDDDMNKPKYVATGETVPRGPFLQLKAEADGEPLVKRRPRKQEKLMREIVESQFSKDFEGTIRRPVFTERSLPYPKTLMLNGFMLDFVTFVGHSIPDACFDDGSWKQEVIGWEQVMYKVQQAFDDAGDTANQPEQGDAARRAKLGDFILALFKGNLFTKEPRGEGTEARKTLVEMYVDHYLVWTDQTPATESPVPISSSLINIFDIELRNILRGWKIATVRRGQMAMVPDSTELEDLIVIIFGADVPLILRHASQGNGMGWLQIGTAYVDGFMSGRALEMAAKWGVEVGTFCLV